MKKITASLLALTTFFLSASPVLAADIQITIKPPPMLEGITFSSLLSGAVGFILVVAALAAFVYLLWGGFQWITSGGDKTKTEEARNRIMAAIIGLFVVFASWAIITIIGEFFGFKITDLKFPKAKPD